MMSAKLSVSLLIWLYLNYLWLRYSWNCINSFEIIKMFKGLFRKGRQLIWRLLLTRMMNCFCRKAFSHITSQRSVDRGSHHCKPPDTPRTGFKLSQNLSLGFGRESCAVVITTTPRFFVSQIEKLLSYEERKYAIWKLRGDITFRHCSLSASTLSEGEWLHLEYTMEHESDPSKSTNKQTNWGAWAMFFFNQKLL